MDGLSCPLGGRLAVAVSGGGDSLALTLLAGEWASQTGRDLVALSVDHGLRKEAAQECDWVGETLARYGIEHHTLVWLGDKPASGLQAAARKARYHLLEEWCCANAIEDLLLAHHLDDQGETFLLRLARGSGVDGLSAMQKVSCKGKLRLLRPLLDVPKSSLISYLEKRGQNWIEDPSNDNEDFERVKIRKQKALFNELGLTGARLAQTARHMQRVSGVLNRLAQEWLQTHADLHEEGYLFFASSPFRELEEEIAFRILARIGMALSGNVYPPRFERLKRLYDGLRNGQDATLMGCRWIQQEGLVLVCREIREETIPENLYRIDMDHFDGDLHMRILGADGWRMLVTERPDLKDANLPKPVLYSLVSFWDGNVLVSVPHLDYVRQAARFEAKLTFIAKKRLFS